MMYCISSSNVCVLSLSLCRCPRAWPVPRHECDGVDKCDNDYRRTSGADQDKKPLGEEELGWGVEGEVWREKMLNHHILVHFVC